MTNKKNIVKIITIGMLSTSILASVTLNSHAYDNNERIYKRGNQIVRVYSSTENLDSSYSSMNSNETSENNNSYSKNSNSTDQKNNFSSKKNNSSNQSEEIIFTNEKIYTKGSQIVRTYGSNNSSKNDNQNNSNNTASSNENNTNNAQNDPTALTNNKIDNLVLNMLSLINNERSNNNLKPLEFDNKLASVAQLKAEDMVENNYLSHNSRKYGSLYSMLNSADIKYYNAGENIAKAFSVDSAHKNFMNSGMHRNAILASHFTHVGIGIAKQSNGMYKISVMFIEKKK